MFAHVCYYSSLDISDYHAMTQTITFTPGQSVGTWRNITISIIDNSVVEDTESFFGILYTTSQDVMLSNRTEIFILDNDGKKAHSYLIVIFILFLMSDFSSISGCHSRFVEVKKLMN